ncbi:Transcription elongation factor S-II, central domain [Dillenia turbinata]|uniref:Transcription elongation factor n=1 Tax=Dillenia turbinata TaxID=194707 RepID=A0AAN8VTQ6_9MAGN
MDKELVDLFEVAKTSAEAAADDDGGLAEEQERQCIHALKQLRGFPVTYQLLVSTQVGKRLRQITKHPNKEIQSSASELLDIWKKIVIDETSKSKTDESLDTKTCEKADIPKFAKTHESSSPRSTKVTKLEAVDVAKVEKTKSHGGIEVKKIESKQKYVTPPELTGIVKCNDALRDRTRELLSEALSKVSGEADDEIKEQVNLSDPNGVAISVETAMFGNWGRSNGTQKAKYRSILFNLKDPNNPDFRRKVLLGQIRPQQILNMSAEDMASHERQLQNQKIKERAMLECELGGTPKASTDQFKCERCGRRRCTYYQMQTRSADEPMTTFVTCVNCNHHWKFC